ncbi:MAG: bifunctional 2-polyprenyl-6-hydroxyphenol methylase/3-demethylubiquinol 3-O-methyltransferase UbiG [Calothrix sp. FI2-JRJ7]|nr:bifunctional 2-polyprenyl-6-hydroxyphenol methylase/3-demethylubiquinol 3-O-methyltransferase UbiG [Calothrix sp. FI2-JRJ7]
MKRNDLEYYDLNANKWWQSGETLHLSNHLNESRFKFFSSFVPNWEGVRVLDIGCGGGLACEFLAKQGANVSGIDLSLNSIEAAQEHAQHNKLKIDYRWGVGEKIPYDSNTFDVVLCFDVLEHVTDWQKVLAEIYRLLNPNGLFLFDTINRTFKSKLIMIWLLENILNQMPRGLHDWNKFIKPQELIDTSYNTGFTDVLIKGFDLTGGMSIKTLKNILFQGLNNTKKGADSELFEIEINDDISIWYIGKGVKLL